MAFSRNAGRIALMLAATFAGAVDAANAKELIGGGAKAVLIFGSLVIMMVCAGAASKDHRALLANAVLALGTIALSHWILAALISRS
jgi:hypothetical protein